MSGEKTEEPTHKKLEDLRNKGKVPKSKDTAATISLLTLLFFVVSMTGAFMKIAIDMFMRCFATIAIPGVEITPNLYAAAGRALAWGTLPVCALAFALAVVGNVIQTGFLLSFEALAPELGKLNPASNLKQMFSPDAFFEFGMSFLKVGVLGWIFYSVAMGCVPALITSLYSGKSAAMPILNVVFKQLLYTFSIAFAVMAGADYVFRKFRFIKQNMMTKDEVKREYKDSEGDPHIKSRRKQIAEEAIEQAILDKTRQSTVLVMNPTHYAVALFYEENTDRLPLVMGKGEGRLALRMMKAAQEAGVPIMRDIPLARGLFAEAVVDHQIPVTFIKPVAETLKWARRFRRGQSL